MNIPVIFTYLATTGEPDVEIIQPFDQEALPESGPLMVIFPVLLIIVGLGLKDSVVFLPDYITG